MTEEVFKIDDTSSLKDVQNDVAKVLARLGDEGWEMVGCGAVFAAEPVLKKIPPYGDKVIMITV